LESVFKNKIIINNKIILQAMVKREVLGALLDSKKAAILKVLVNSKEELFLKEVAEKSGVAMASAFRILQELVKKEIIERKEWKNSKVYGCGKNEKAEFLKELFYEEYDGVSEFVSRVQDFSGIQNIILHGGRKKGKANVLLIGEGIDSAAVEHMCKQVREKGFELSYLTLTKEQYEQMAQMGLYSGEKKVLK